MIAAPASEPAPTRLTLTVWQGPGGGWRARVEWGLGERRDFDSPFELARFIAHPPLAPPPAQPEPRGGLR